MALFKCKMCGGSLDVPTGETIIECEYCGTQQTLPKTTDENIQSLFNRASFLRQKSEFDKAEAVYEKILAADETEAEAYWGVILCKFGIEYVEDPATYKRVPTCHRTSYDSIIADEYYKKALELADTTQRVIYEKEAQQIDEIQKGILAISAQEEPFDVFICYKETGEGGQRTQDSVIANDIYYQLTNEGFKVFYAAVTLEDRLGSAYEPVIFAALNSSKVMLAIGTKPEYFTAVWVKNEWSRFLKLMKKDRSKMLIPAYKDMDPYELPEEFAHLQAQDMGKIGFINDIVRGIKKVVTKEEAKPAVIKETVVTTSTANSNAAPLLRRAFIFLEDGDWDSADEYCEKVLDIDPENAQAYLGKLMAELQVSYQEALKDEKTPFDGNNNYQKVLRFADEHLKAELVGYAEHIKTRNEKARLDSIYTRGQRVMTSAETETAYKEAAYLFESIAEYQDSAILAAECYEKAEEAWKDAILAKGKYRMRMAGEVVGHYEEVIRTLEHIPGWKDADAEVLACERKIAELKAIEKAERIRQEELDRRKAKRKKTIAIVTGAAVCVVAAVVAVLVTVIIPNGKYNDAIALMDAGRYSEAMIVFRALEGYKDSATKQDECNVIILDGKYSEALALMDAGKYSEAISVFEELEGYKDSAVKINECNTAILEGRYNEALALMDAGKYSEAMSVFEELGGYKDSVAKLDECSTVILAGKYDEAIHLMVDGKNNEALIAFAAISGYKDARELWSALSPTIAAGDEHTVGLRSDGTVVVAADDRNGSWCDVGGWKDIVAVAAGGYHTVGLKSDGTVVAVGSNLYGRCDVSDWTDIVAVAAGDYHTVGLKSDGTVVAVGSNEDGQCDVGGWKDIVAVAAGKRRTIGLKSDGTVVAVGSYVTGSYDVSGWKDIVAVAVGVYHTVGLKSDGTVVVVDGSNTSAQYDVGGWKDIVAVAAGDYHTVGLKANGTVVTVAEYGFSLYEANGWKDIVAVAAGANHTVGLKSNGTVVVASDHIYDRDDVGDWKDIVTP